MFTVSKLNKAVTGRHLLRNVTFALKRGEIGLFLGGSGVGKSTLFRVLNHLTECDSGECTLDDKKLDLSAVSKNNTVGMVFQHFNLFENMSVEKNITLPLIKLKGMSPKEAQRVADNLLDRYELSGHAKLSVHKLSGGQKQRLAIARTLAMDPEIICLDEPTSALDPRLTGQVAAIISEMAAQGKIVLVSTHDMQLLNQLEATVFLMESGTIVESVPLHAYRSAPAAFPALSRYLSHT